MSGTYRGSISIEIPEAGADAAVHPVRWARVDLADFFWIGRVSICNLKIQGDTQVSRLHATIHREGEHYLLTDMQSRNGTAVNGRRVTAMRLAPGDQVRVGETLFEFEPDNKEDTLFKEGTSRVIGGADVELKSFPSSIAMLAPPSGISLPPVPRASSLDEFLTIVVDRLVVELDAELGIIHVPAIDERSAITHVRGVRDGRLELHDSGAPFARRIAQELQPLRAGEPVPEEGERLVWRGAHVEARLTAQDRLPRQLPPGSGFTIAMPRLGRTDVRAAKAGIAFLHVGHPRANRSAARTLDEVAAAVNVSVLRFLERGA